MSKQISGAGRRRVDCPKCLSSNRDRLIWEYLKPYLPNLPHTTASKATASSSIIKTTSNNPKTNENKSSRISILHVAPEIPLSTKLLALQDQNCINYQGIDLKTPGYHYPRWVKDADLTALPFANNHFDIIIASHVLEHIPNLQNALKEIHRTLKPGGQAIIMFPVSQNHPTDDYYHPDDFKDDKTEKIAPTRREKINRFGQHDHIRLFGTDAPEILSQANLEVVVINQNSQPELYEFDESKSSPANEILFMLKKG